MTVNRRHHLLYQPINFYSVQVEKMRVLVFAQPLPLVQEIQV